MISEEELNDRLNETLDNYHVFGDGIEFARADIKRLISDVVDELLPPYRHEETERDRGNNDVLDVIATRREKLGL